MSSSSTDQNFERERELFLGALERSSAAERAAFLDQACAGDALLRARVEELVRNHEADDFLKVPAPGVETGPISSAPIDNAPGMLIGRYKLLEKIGEGGMGAVYMAEQTEPVRRRVALKVIKPGMDSRGVIARLEAERQALALMDHPNIAKVLDAGTTDQGRPYLVMELVHGVPLTEFCEQNQLDINQRLKLVISVCQATQHAHQKGIIHRDLKPSNVLVTLHDGEPVPKVIDFGVAKALDQSLTEKTLFTNFGTMIGTMAYMSPEQAEMSGLDIDTRSDIYSLGVLLYELLTGSTPFPQMRLKNVAFVEMQRILREEEPERPSTRLKKTALAASASSLTSRPSPLASDLDWIVMKCLEKDRARRYETASGLASDIQRHINNEPVLARPPSKAYRLQKAIRRNRSAFVAVAAVLFALVAGIAASAWQAVRATRANQTQAQVSQFLKEMLKGVGPSVAQGRDTTLLREILEKTVARLDQLKGEPQAEADLRVTIGSVYRALGDYAAAEAMCRRAATLLEVTDAKPLTLAATLNNLGNILYHQSKLKEAESAHRKALALRKQHLAHDDPDVAISLSNLGNVLWAQGKLTGAEQMNRNALAIQRKRLGDEHEDTLATLDNLSGVLSNQEKFDEAEPMQRQALNLNVKLLGNEHPDVAISMGNLADTLHALGRLEEAEGINRKVLELRRRLLGEEHPDVAYTIYALGSILLSEGKLAEAEATARLALAMRRKFLGKEHTEVAGSLTLLAAVLIQKHALAEAETLQREALEIQQKAFGPEHQHIAGSFENLGTILHLQGKPHEAERPLRDALAMSRKLMGNDSLDVARALKQLALVLIVEGKFVEAEAAAHNALGIRRSRLGKIHGDVASAQATLAIVLFQQGRLIDAEALLREEIQLWRQLTQREAQPAFLRGLAKSLSNLTATLLAQEQHAAAEPVVSESLEILASQSAGDWSLANAQSLLGASLTGQGKFADAERLLLLGYQGISTSIGESPLETRRCLNEAIKRLVRLYEATGDIEKTAIWKERLDDYH